jgi:hypothetical protein
LVPNRCDFGGFVCYNIDEEQEQEEYKMKKLSFKDWMWALTMRFEALYGDREVPECDFRALWKTGKTPVEVTTEWFGN